MGLELFGVGVPEKKKYLFSPKNWQHICWGLLGLSSLVFVLSFVMAAGLAALNLSALLLHLVVLSTLVVYSIDVLNDEATHGLTNEGLRQFGKIVAIVAVLPALVLWSQSTFMKQLWPFGVVFWGYIGVLVLAFLVLWAKGKIKRLEEPSPYPLMPLATLLLSIPILVFTLRTTLVESGRVIRGSIDGYKFYDQFPHQFFRGDEGLLIYGLGVTVLVLVLAAWGAYLLSANRTFAGMVTTGLLGVLLFIAAAGFHRNEYPFPLYEESQFVEGIRLVHPGSLNRLPRR